MSSSWTNDELADLTVELNALLNAWDPIGVADLTDDEYLSLTGLLLPRLARGDSRADFCQFLYEIGPEYGASGERADRFGAEVYVWFHAKRG